MFGGREGSQGAGDVVVSCGLSPGFMLVVITSFLASTHLNAKVIAGVLVFVSKYYMRDSETENLISC